MATRTRREVPGPQALEESDFDHYTISGALFNLLSTGDSTVEGLTIFRRSLRANSGLPPG